MSVFARLQPLTDAPHERRRAPRLLLKLGATVGSGSAALIHDLSTKGLLFETAEDLGGDRVDVHLPAAPAVAARVVWSHGRFYGCEFEEPIPTASVSAALLRSEPKLWDEMPSAQLPPNHPVAEAGGLSSLRRWFAAALTIAVIAAGAAALVLSGHLVALVAICIGGLVILGLLAATMYWSLDNTLNIKI